MVADQINSQIITSAILTQMAVHSMLSKKAAKAFEKKIESLTPDG